MKKLGISGALFAALLALAAVHCGSGSACDDLKATEIACCDKETDATAKKSCEDGVNSAFKQLEAAGDSGDLDTACSESAKAFTCTVK